MPRTKSSNTSIKAPFGNEIIAKKNDPIPSTLNVFGGKIKPREIFKKWYQDYVRPEIKLVVFDLDDTLIDEDGIPFNDAEEILRWSKEKGLFVALASYNSDAERILRRLRWIKYFDYIAPFGMTETKKIHLSDILMALGIKPAETIFVDDRFDNVMHARELGIHVLKVDPKHGAQLNSVVNVIMG
jgi:HAD superfamily phosphatase (TIGR01681 family)